MGGKKVWEGGEEGKGRGWQSSSLQREVLTEINLRRLFTVVGVKETRNGFKFVYIIFFY